MNKKVVRAFEVTLQKEQVESYLAWLQKPKGAFFELSFFNFDGLFHVRLPYINLKEETQ